MANCKRQSLQARIDLFDEAIYLTCYNSDSQPAACRELAPADLAAAFAGVPIASPLLPPGSLSWSRADGREKIVLYLPPERRRVIVMDGDDRTPLDVPFPPLVLAGSGTRYQLYAVKQLPSQPTERLFCAPFPNVNGPNGTVCWGDILPPSARADTIWKAVELFLESDFNGHWSNNASQEFHEDVRDLWRELYAKEESVYPLDDLVQTHRKLGDIL